MEKEGEDEDSGVEIGETTIEGAIGREERVRGGGEEEEIAVGGTKGRG